MIFLYFFCPEKFHDFFFVTRGCLISFVLVGFILVFVLRDYVIFFCPESLHDLFVPRGCMIFLSSREVG